MSQSRNPQVTMDFKLIYEYQKNIKEIKVLEQELERYENYR